MDEEVGGMEFFHKRWGGGDIRNQEIFGWRKICMIMLFNEIVLEMHIFCATSTL